ncbi:MAG: hypothetical protein HUU60_04790 [Armatimonadetes bacterium]|nr:hypothetical protein [Armatimonadota bacterium]
MKRLISLALVFMVVPLFAQRASGWNGWLDPGVYFEVLSGSGYNSFQWAQLRADQDVPPRTVRYGHLQTVLLTEGGDAFGRMVLFWSGYQQNGGDRSQYWLHNVLNASPILQGGRAGALYDMPRLMQVRIWNEQLFSWQPRYSAASLYVSNAPSVQLVAAPEPRWTDVSWLDINPHKPGIQIDPKYLPDLNLEWSTGSATARRTMTSVKKLVGRNQYADANFPSPFRDDFGLRANVSVRVGDQRFPWWQASPSLPFLPGGLIEQRTIVSEYGSTAIGLRSLPLGTTIALAFEVEARRGAYDELGQAIEPNIVREPMDDLRDAASLNFDIRALTYRYSGALSGGGDVRDEEADPICVSKEAGSLDIRLNLIDLGLPYDVPVVFSGSRIDAETIEWTLNAQPNLCVNLGAFDALIKRIAGKLRGRIVAEPLFFDPLCNAFFNLQITPIGGDAHNWLDAEVYALCFESSITRVNVTARSIDYRALSGSPAAFADPRVLSRVALAQAIELAPFGDINQDGCVDDQDLAELLADFGMSGAHRSDISGNGFVDDYDLAILLENFGRGC